MSWTEERTATLKRMWEGGSTATEIAKELGEVSRNAVIGKAHRLGLKSRPSPVKSAEKKAPASKAKPAPKKKAAPAPTPAAAPKPAAPKCPASLPRGSCTSADVRRVGGSSDTDKIASGTDKMASLICANLASRSNS